MRKSTIVYPSIDTPKNSIYLSDIDLTKRTPFAHIPSVYLYPYDPNSNNHFNSTLLKSSLSELLVSFYPLAGRLRKNNVTGRIEVDCNAKGVVFVEVETSQNVSDFGDFVPNQVLKKLVIPTCDYSARLEDIPLMMVQLTRFRCGSVTLGLAVHHFLGDGVAYTYMVNQWARLARGVGLTVSPLFDRARVLAPRNPPQVKFDHLEFQRRPSDLDQLSSDSKTLEGTKVGIFKFSQDQITALKHQATNYSTFEVIAAHVWQCALKARGVEDDKLVKLFIPVNGRPKFNNMPQGYFGNFVFNAACIVKSGEIVSKPLWYAVSKIHEAVTMVNEEYIKSAVDFISLEPDLTAYAMGPHTTRCPDLLVNYWKGFQFFDADFGCGKPVFLRHGGIGHEGQTFIMPNEKGDCLYVALNLFSSHMDRFEKLIYDFGERCDAL